MKFPDRRGPRWPSLALSDAEIDEIMNDATPLDRPMPRHILNITPTKEPPPRIEPVDWRSDD